MANAKKLWKKLPNSVKRSSLGFLPKRQKLFCSPHKALEIFTGESREIIPYVEVTFEKTHGKIQLETRASDPDHPKKILSMVKKHQKRKRIRGKIKYKPILIAV